jgi:hypothetical protein
MKFSVKKSGKGEERQIKKKHQIKQLAAGETYIAWIC